MQNNLKTFLDKLFINSWVYFYTIDNLFNKIVIFCWGYILEVSTIDRWCQLRKSNKLFFYFRKFSDINKVYKYINNEKNYFENKKIWLIIKLILKYENIIYNLFVKQNKWFFKNIFKKININKKILFILKWGGLEEIIEKSFISFCNFNNIDLTVLYKFWTWYWWQKLNQDWFFNELKINNPNIKFLYNKDFDDNFIDNIVRENTEIFSFQYDYKWKYKNLNMIILSSVTDTKIDCNRYKNIFSSYKSKSIWYSTDEFINYDNTNIYKIFNAQDIELLNNYSIILDINECVLSWWMDWARDFSILNWLKWKYKWVMISDEKQNIEWFLDMYRGIQSYYWFFWAFKLSKFFIACHLEKYNDDDRSKMIATSICCWKPVIIPYNDWEIVKTVLKNKLWITYKNWDKKDLFEKVEYFYNNKEILEEYSKNCLNYSSKNMDINKFINLIFEKTFNAR